MRCSKCSGRHDRQNQRYCADCHAAYMRDWRKTHPLTPEQKRKDNARSYANTYKKRGKLVPLPCTCGSMRVQMHHPDYDRPLDVVWMCRPCHLAHHRAECFTIDIAA